MQTVKLANDTRSESFLFCEVDVLYNTSSLSLNDTFSDDCRVRAEPPQSYSLIVAHVVASLALGSTGKPKLREGISPPVMTTLSK